MKKTMCVLLAALLALAGMMAMAENSASLSVSGASGKPGDQVTVTVSVSGNTGFSAVDSHVSYDSDKLQLVSFDTSGTLLSGAESYAQTGMISFAKGSDVTGNGALYRLKFKILDGAEGSASVTATVDLMRPADPDSAPLMRGASKTGTVSIEAPAPVTPTPSPAPQTPTPSPAAVTSTPSPTPAVSGGSSGGNSGSGSGSSGYKVPATGDERNIASFIVLIGVGCAGIGMCLALPRRKKKK